jgi:hypothetical protein
MDRLLRKSSVTVTLEKRLRFTMKERRWVAFLN